MLIELENILVCKMYGSTQNISTYFAVRIILVLEWHMCGKYDLKISLRTEKFLLQYLLTLN